MMFPFFLYGSKGCYEASQSQYQVLSGQKHTYCTTADGMKKYTR